MLARSLLPWRRRSVLITSSLTAPFNPKLSRPYVFPDPYLPAIPLPLLPFFICLIISTQFQILSASPLPVFSSSPNTQLDQRNGFTSSSPSAFLKVRGNSGSSSSLTNQYTSMCTASPAACGVGFGVGIFIALISAGFFWWRYRKLKSTMETRIKQVENDSRTKGNAQALKFAHEARRKQRQDVIEAMFDHEVAASGSK